MPEITEADKYLLQQIAAGNPDGWSELVERYQGRLLAFARGRLHRKEEAEDLVQDTFIAFLEGLPRFRENASVETFLFTILRHKLIDFFRGRQMKTCFIQEVVEADSGESDPQQVLPSPGQTASWYARTDEQSDQLRTALAGALEVTLERLQQAENFRDLQILEMVFYAQIRNKDSARLLGMDEKQIALIKHRALKEIREHVARHASLNRGDAALLDAPAWEQSTMAASLLTEVWESRRPTCPKRSTLGRFVLNTLEPQWKQYVEFHTGKLGCRFCQANLEDLRKQTEEQPKQLHHRVMQSTVGFFRKT